MVDETFLASAQAHFNLPLCPLIPRLRAFAPTRWNFLPYPPGRANCGWTLDLSSAVTVWKLPPVLPLPPPHPAQGQATV